MITIFQFLNQSCNMSWLLDASDVALSDHKWLHYYYYYYHYYDQQQQNSANISIIHFL